MGAVVNAAALQRPETAGKSRRRRVDLPRILLARFAATLDRLKAWLENRRSRRMLMELTDSQLKDIGLSPADIVGRGRGRFRLVPANDR